MSSARTKKIKIKEFGLSHKNGIPAQGNTSAQCHKAFLLLVTFFRYFLHIKRKVMSKKKKKIL